VEATAFVYVPPAKLEMASGLATEALPFIKMPSGWPSESPIVRTLGGLGGLHSLAPPEQSPSIWTAYGNLVGEEKEAAKGRTALEVDWSVAVSTSRTLSAPRIEGLKFIETVWD
jgi:hypothetical protein